MICITSYKKSIFTDYGLQDIQNNDLPLQVNCAGHYRLVKLKYLETTRPNGRSDYQIIYVAKGSSHFLIDGKYREVPAGNIIIFRPGEKQFYFYRLEEKPDIYWIHFTGNNCESLLQQFFPEKKSPINVGVDPSITSLFSNIIHELQLQRKSCNDIATLLLQQLFYEIDRFRIEAQENHSYYKHEAISAAILYMHVNFQQAISIKELAEEFHLTYNWFIRCFMKFTGSTPQNYLTNIRIKKAQELLPNTVLRISEISQLIGYSDPLYFSRVFKKNVGQPPKEYRRMHMKKL